MCAPFTAYVVAVRVVGQVRLVLTGRICRGPVCAPYVSRTVGYQARPCEICGGQGETRYFTVTLLRFSPVNNIPPLLHTHSSIYHPRCVMFFSQYFNFPLSVPFHHCSILIHSSTIHAINVFLPVLQFSPVSIIPPLLHTHSFIYHPCCIMFFSQHFSFPLSVSFHHCSILIHSSTTHAV